MLGNRTNILISTLINPCRSSEPYLYNNSSSVSISHQTNTHRAQATRNCPGKCWGFRWHTTTLAIEVEQITAGPVFVVALFRLVVVALFHSTAAVDAAQSKVIMFYCCIAPPTHKDMVWLTRNTCRNKRLNSGLFPGHARLKYNKLLRTSILSLITPRVPLESRWQGKFF